MSARSRRSAYLLKGGFLWVDDFWGSYAWADWVAEIGRVLPAGEYPIQDLTPAHPIYRTQFQIAELPQIPSIQSWRGNPHETSERGDDSAEPHFRAIFDARGNIMVLMTHNTDISDAWEREGEDPRYFYQFSPRLRGRDQRGPRHDSLVLSGGEGARVRARVRCCESHPSVRRSCSCCWFRWRSALKVRSSSSRFRQAVECDGNLTFTRLFYGSSLRGFGFGGAAWSHDYPAADKNLSAIIDYITHIRVRLDGTNVLDLDDPEIFQNPVLYVWEPGFWTIQPSEAKQLREYC